MRFCFNAVIDLYGQEYLFSRQLIHLWGAFDWLVTLSD